MGDTMKRLGEKLAGYKYVLIVGLVGLALLLLPSGKTADSLAADDGGEEARLAAVLTQIEGVGQARVLLSEEGAVVVCPGADSPSVCLRVTQAVRCYTGLGADEVKVFKSESSWRDEH